MSENKIIFIHVIGSQVHILQQHIELSSNFVVYT